jgi:hypothetical protein
MNVTVGQPISHRIDHMLHAGDLPHLDRSRARPAVGGGSPFPLFDCGTGSHSGSHSHHGYVSRVRFETSAFFRGPSQERRGLKPRSVCAPSCPGLPTASSPGQHVALRRFYQAGPPTLTRKPPSVLSPFAQLRRYLRLGRRDFHLLRGRYPSVLAPTGSCATPLGLSPPPNPWVYGRAGTRRSCPASSCDGHAASRGRRPRRGSSSASATPPPPSLACQPPNHLLPAAPRSR